MSNMIKKSLKEQGKPAGYISAADRQKDKRIKEEQAKAKTKLINKARKSKELERELINFVENEEI